MCIRDRARTAHSDDAGLACNFNNLLLVEQLDIPGLGLQGGVLSVKPVVFHHNGVALAAVGVVPGLDGTHHSRNRRMHRRRQPRRAVCDFLPQTHLFSHLHQGLRSSTPMLDERVIQDVWGRQRFSRLFNIKRTRYFGVDASVKGHTHSLSPSEKDPFIPLYLSLIHI